MVDILLTNNNVVYIKSTFQNIEFKFLVDTGANVSLIKLPKLKQTQCTFNSAEKLTLNGLSANSPVSTIGSIVLPLNIHNKIFQVKFHIVKAESNLPFDGLIGNDFLKNEMATICYEKNQLKLNCLPFPIPLHLNSNPSSSETYFLEPRSETVIEIDILNTDLSEGITPEIQVCEGVFLAKALLKVNNQKAFTTILNTTNKKAKINHIKLYLEPFEQNNCTVLNVDKQFTSKPDF